jgi:hypothetical protein
VMECFFICSADRAADRLAEKKAIRNRKSGFKNVDLLPKKELSLQHFRYAWRDDRHDSIQRLRGFFWAFE